MRPVSRLRVRPPISRSTRTTPDLSLLAFEPELFFLVVFFLLDRPLEALSVVLLERLTFLRVLFFPVVFLLAITFFSFRAYSVPLLQRWSVVDRRSARLLRVLAFPHELRVSIGCSVQPCGGHARVTGAFVHSGFVKER